MLSDQDGKAKGTRKRKRNLKKLEKRFLNLSINHCKHSKRRRKPKLETIKEDVDSGDETDILLSDSEVYNKKTEKDDAIPPEIPLLRRENGLYVARLTARL